MPHFDNRRLTVLSDAPYGPGHVVYWMSRDQRVRDNWALVYAYNTARELNRGLAVVFCLVPVFLGATMRQYDFMLRGLAETAEELARKNIPFHLLTGDPPEQLARYERKHKPALIVTDFDPLRVKRGWVDALIGSASVPIHEVDAHNIVPCRYISNKLEYGAYTLRPKINRVLDEFLTPFPPIRTYSNNPAPASGLFDLEKHKGFINVDTSVQPVDSVAPGTRAGIKRVKDFILKRLNRYSEYSSDPNAGAVSRLSPYLHFGQASAQRVALEVLGSDADDTCKNAFLEQLIVRRELSDNHCLHNPHYDSFGGIPDWAKETLDGHRNDVREYVYSPDALESARTHDPLWNAAQNEMVNTGYMHGYMRMYWAKKILEWTRSPEEAMRIAIHLNDRYLLDGRDPNGYTGIAWSIGGRHDRAWPEREIFGKVRYMNYAGAKRKFDVGAYISANSPG